MRRKFVEAQDNNPAKASEALAFIHTLYAVEKEIAERKLTGDAAVSLRRTRAGPIRLRFGEWLEEENRTALPKSPFGQAVGYTRAEFVQRKAWKVCTQGPKRCDVSKLCDV